jgi:ABC-2 type transport system ATP-binding protein
MIELEGITKKYADFTAVSSLNLTANPGEIFGFIGPNGAGKTTTIKIISGILAPTTGRIRICGIDIQQQPVAAKKKIGFIPDRPYLYEKLTGLEFMQFTADLYGVNKNGFRQKAETELKRFALSDWSNELIESYSHGMRQRLIFAAALVHDPQVLVVDEPMVGLDPVALKVAEDICDRLGVINKGRMIATGTTEDLQREAGVSDADLEQVFLNLTTHEEPK